MRFFIGLIVFAVAFIFAVSIGFSKLHWVVLFFDVIILVLVLLPAVGFSICVTSLKALKDGLRIIFSSNSQFTEQEVKGGIIAFTVFGNVGLLMGIIGTFNGLVLMGANMTDLTGLGPNLSVAFLCFVYGLLVKTVSYAAQKRLEFLAN